MRNIYWIMRRELGVYLRTPIGYIVATAVLAVDGLFFNAVAVGGGKKLSTGVIEQFFYGTSGVTLFAAVFIGMRLIAEERQSGTLVLLTTSPVRDWQLIAAKFLSAWIYLGVLLALTVYMPALVLLNGKVSLGHLAAGYSGLMLMGGAAISMTLLCSALAPNQLVAAILGGAIVTVFILLWVLSKIASPPIEDLVAYMSLHDKHFRPFMRGLVSTRDVVFYVSLSYVSLLCATRVLEARRWR